MATVTPAAVRRQIQSGTTDPVYLLLGEDDVEKSALANDFSRVIDEGVRAFNIERIYAGDMTTGERLADGVASLVSAARTLPMMSPRRIVIVMQAETLLLPRRESDTAMRALDQLEKLLEDPDPQTTIVFVVAASLDKRSRMYKLLAKRATLVECGTIEDVADTERWVRARVAEAGAEIAAPAARLIAQRAGTDVRRLRGDIDRLLLYALGQKTIGVEDVRQVVGPVALQDDWAMTNAIEAGDAAEALRQLALMLDAGVPPEKILGQLGWLVRSRFPQNPSADLESAVASLFRTDLDLKRSAGDPRVLLERLIVELCAGKRARRFVS